MLTPSVWRRLGSLFYDMLTFATLWLLATVLFTLGFGPADSTVSRSGLQWLCAIITASYFLWCWVHGQTLAMRVWRIRIVDTQGHHLTPYRALWRLWLAIVSIGLGGLGIWWTLLDSERQFLHDRLAGTRLRRAS